MKDYQKQFIEFAITSHVLRFGTFTLKSGRESPFFFDFSAFSSGEALARLGTYYSKALQESELTYDVVKKDIIIAIWV
jgi:orotate phosphoribosyltransferase